MYKKAACRAQTSTFLQFCPAFCDVARLQNDVQAFCTVLYCAVYIDSSSIASVLTQLKTFEQYRVIVLAGEAQWLCPQPTRPLCSKAFIESWNVYDKSLGGPGKLLSCKEISFDQLACTVIQLQCVTLHKLQFGCFQLSSVLFWFFFLINNAWNRASHGTKSMTSEEVLEIYGRKEWKHFNTVSGMVSRTGSYTLACPLL